jgi:hypothetical protein
MLMDRKTTNAEVISTYNVSMVIIGVSLLGLIAYGIGYKSGADQAVRDNKVNCPGISKKCGDGN